MSCERGRRFFKQMTQMEFSRWTSTMPMLLTFLVMLGALNKHINLVNSKPVEPTGIVWGAMLAAFRESLDSIG